jgi:hypothetical protein
MRHLYPIILNQGIDNFTLRGRPPFPTAGFFMNQGILIRVIALAKLVLVRDAFALNRSCFLQLASTWR